MPLPRVVSHLLHWCPGLVLPALLAAVPVDFKLPPQPAADALLAFSQQAKLEVVFPFGELRKVNATAVTGLYEPEDALNRLLRDTGFAARRNSAGKFVIVSIIPPTGSLNGRLVAANGPVAKARVVIRDTRQATTTDRDGRFDFVAVLPGSHRLVATKSGYRPLEIASVRVEAGQNTALEPQTLLPNEELVRLDPYVVKGEVNEPGVRYTAPPTPRAAGNIDLFRTENDALPYTVYGRDQIARSGVVDLNEFLQRELLDSDAVTRPPEQDGSQNSYVAGSSNLKLRGYNADETVVLVNGRRLPEIITSVSGSQPPDVNSIPLSLVERVEVLPVSAAALYSGNAVGGVINIVLRSDAAADVTEVTTTYTNALGRFDAPQSSVSLQHAQSLLDGRLRFRVSATLTRSSPPTESELGYRRIRVAQTTLPGDTLFRATPNVRSADGSPLFGPGTANFTSVAPGEDGSGGLAAFAGRAGRQSLDLFDAPGGLAAYTDSLDHPYGRRQQRAAYFGSVTYDVRPWLQLGVDANYSQTVVNRGYNIFTTDLTLPADSAFNPFQKDVNVSVAETAPVLGENYGEAQIDFSSIVFGALVKLPAGWQATVDAQYAHNLTRYRGLAPVDADRWQQLVDQGRYNPLRDTQVYGPPQEFYDRVLVYYGGRGRFVTLGNYDTLDAAVRVSHQSLDWWTGPTVVNLGTDYRRSHLAGYTEEQRYGDGTLVRFPNQWLGRTIQRYSFFGEVQTPLVPAKRLPRWLKSIELDAAARYVAADSSAEENVAPAVGLKVGFDGGLTIRGSYTQANRFPNPQMSKSVFVPLPGSGPGIGFETATIFDPVRNENYSVLSTEELNPDLRAEASATATVGVVYQRGKIHRIRAALDFVDTQKANELIPLDPQALLNLEEFFPGRVIRGPLPPDDTHAAGLVTSVLTGQINAAHRHSQNWNLTLDYAWAGFMGGTLELYGRGIYFQRYDRQLVTALPTVDELGAPDGLAANGLLRYRANFGAGWSNRNHGFGLDGHYFHSRRLPVTERFNQGDKQIKPYWQFDAYVQSDLTRWLPWHLTRFGLRGQLRVNNISGFDYPKYVNDPSGAAVQPYGDWRGRTYSLSVTATF